MENIVEKLKKYFEETSEEQFLKDWKETEEFDNIGITVDEFIKNNIIMNKKLKLIEALKEERARFEKNNHSTFEHDIVIEYLETGRTDEDPEEYQLLDAVINDFDCVCSDYAVN